MKKSFQRVRRGSGSKNQIVCERFAPDHPPQFATECSMSIVVQRPAHIAFAGTGDSLLRLMNLLQKNDMSSHRRNDGHLTDTPDSESIRQH